jgi:hypothetical protein
MILVLCPFIPPMSIQLHLPRPALSRPTFFMYPVHSLKQIASVPPSCTHPVCLSLCPLCDEMAVQANSHWNICLRLFLLSLWQKLSLCLQYKTQSMSRSSLISSAFANFSLPPILLLKPLQFSPIILNIPDCLVFGAMPSICSSPSWTRAAVHPRLNPLNALPPHLLACHSP